MENVRTQAVRKLRAIFDRNKAPSKSTVRRLVTKFETTGLVLTVKSPERERSRPTEKQLVLVQDSIIAFAAVGYPDLFIASNFA